MTNLTNAQQSEVLNTQNRQQAMLSDQAAANAAAQFNASSENQATEFMTNLSSTIDIHKCCKK